MVRILMFGAALVLGFLWIAGAFSTHLDPANPAPVPVATLLDHPETYENTFVTVSGTVAQRVSIFGYGGFYLRDGTGHNLLVISQTTPLAPDRSVTIQGRYRSAFTLGDSAFPVLFAHP